MNISKVVKLLALSLLLVVVSSCKTQEEKVISKMQALAERVESKGDSYNDEEWEKVISDFEALQQQAEECNFTSEQLKEYAKAEAELNTAIVKHGFKKAINGVTDVIEEGAGVVGGILEGIMEGLDDGEDK